VFAPAHPTPETAPVTDGPRLTMQQAVRQVLEDEMTRDPTILVFGEDVGAFGGVHRVTDGLQTRFGEARVFDTSLSEEGIVGRALGMALNGLRPVPEIQFRKYADPAHEQITDAGSIRWRTHGRFGGPIVLRIPVGYQIMGGDPWHAVCGEAVFAHLPGWQIAYPSTAADAVGLLRTALRGDDPTVFLEHRLLYRYREANTPYPGAEYQVPFGRARWVREGRDALVIAWGESVYRAREAAEALAAEGYQTAILDLRTIVPWDAETVFEAVRRIGKVLIVHEDTRTCGFGAELAAQISDQVFEYLDAPIRRVATEDVPSPSHDNLVAAVMPTTAKIQRALGELLRY
jgi:2-oxoisovalerate dehydrogenase E1 component